MSRIRADRVTNRAGTGAPLFPNGAQVTGVVTATTFKGALEGNVTGNITGTTGSFSGNVSVGGTLTYEDVTNIDSVGLITARSGVDVLAGGINVTGVSTFTTGIGSVHIGTGNTTLLVKGDARITGTVSDSIGSLRRLGQNVQTGNYTLVASDAGKQVRVGGGHTITVPDDVFSTGDMITIVAHSSSDVPITQGIGVSLYNAANGTTGNKTLAARTVCTILVSEGPDQMYIAGGGIS